MYRRELAGEIGRETAAAGGPAAAAPSDIFSARPDLFPPIGAIEFYRFFNVSVPSTGIYAAGTTIALPSRLQMLIPAGFQFRICKLGTLRGVGFSHDQTFSSDFVSETSVSTGNLDPIDLLLDGAPVSGSRLLFDNGVQGQGGQGIDVFIRGRGPVQINVRITKNPNTVSWGSNGAWYRGWMWPSPK